MKYTERLRKMKEAERKLLPLLAKAIEWRFIILHTTEVKGYYYS